MKKIFSIITPTYNVQKKIVYSLNSIINQDTALLEYIIIDGKSNDNTIQVLKEFKKKYKIDLKYISENDEGIYDAMNKGINMAEGEYLYFLGAGDTLKEGILGKIKDKVNFIPEIVYGDVLLTLTGNIVGGEFDQLRICMNNMPHQAIFYHRTVFEMLGLYSIENKILADYEFNIRCFGCNEIKKRYVDIVIANYEGGGVSSTIDNVEFCKSKEKFIKNYLSKNYFELYKLYQSYYSNNWWINHTFVNYLNSKKEDVAIFGAGTFGVDVFNFIYENNSRFNTNLSVKFFLDNDQKKWGKILCNKEIRKPDKTVCEKVHKIIIASVLGRKEIKMQLLEFGICSKKLVLVP